MLLRCPFSPALHGEQVARPQLPTAASERIFGLLDTPVAVAAPRSVRPFPEGPASVEFEGVWFAY